MGLKDLQLFHQDGTSQASRVQKALDPDYVLVDERSIRDLLDFASKYAKQLKYFNDENEHDGDWMGFLNDKDIDAIVEFMKDSGRWEENGREAQKQRLQRPHLVLFLTFLELLQHVRTHLNDFTRRHLEFYYREALRLTAQQGQVDHVHVVVELADGQDQFLLPAGTVLQAGKDSQGKDLFYRSDEDLIANQAAIESVKSIFAQKKIVGIHEARKDFRNLFPHKKEIMEAKPEEERAFMAMLVMALGDPGPGGDLPPYSGDRTVNPALLVDLDELLDFIATGLYMPLATFRLLMQLKNDLTLGEDPQKEINRQWKRINDILERAGKRRDASFQLKPVHADDLENNLLSVLKLQNFDDLFDELPDVDDIYDLYRRRERPEEQKFIQKSLYMSLDDFHAMMKDVEDINGRWRQIYEILREAARKKDPTITFTPPEIRVYKDKKLGDLIAKTLGDITYPTFTGNELKSFEGCYLELSNLENYFHMPAEKFAFVRAINKKQDKAQSWEWTQAYEILEDAYVVRAAIERQNILKEKKAEGFDALILFALGHPNAGDELPESRRFDDLEWPKDQEYINSKLFLAERNFKDLKIIESKGNAITQAEWARACAILEPAQRIKRNVVDRARIEKWENLYAAPDASQVQAQVVEEGESVTPRWKTFGAGYLAKEKSPTVPARIGFAIASPLLRLEEGTRTITLTLGFGAEGFIKVKDGLTDAIEADPTSLFHLLLSTEQEMMKISSTQVNLKLVDPTTDSPAFQHALQFKIELTEQVPAIAPLSSGSDVSAHLPILQITLADRFEEGRPHKQYRAFQGLKLAKIHLSVDVDGISNLVLQNNDNVLDPKKPFEPFGLLPVVGSSFYIAHPELSSKKLDELKLEIDWLGVPNDLRSYYKGYANYETPTDDPASPNTDFRANLKLHDNRSTFPVQDLLLFNIDQASTTRIIKIEKTTITDQIIKKDPSYIHNIAPVVDEEVLNWKQYWQLELLSDFFHSIYPHAAAGCAKKQKPAGTPKPHIVNPPYTPKIKKLTAGYKASLEMDLTGDVLQEGPDQLYHMEPFGYRSLTSYEHKPYFFLPQYENEGELFIGIKNLVAPRNLSLMLQLADGSADPDVEREEIHWSFLSGDQWHSLDQGMLLSDTTNGLLNSGILKLSLPAVQASTLLPSDQYWIRASIAKNSKSVADTVSIQTQAVRATFDDRSNANDHLSQPLPSETIRSLEEVQPEVRAIHQPFSSFGGKSPEPASQFYTRVSERLRHKDRALTLWDYEHMVLEMFPEIYKVKCLPAGTSEDPSLADVVQIIVIPDIRGKLPFDPFEPKAPADVLKKIEQYLIAHSSPYARLIVKNPTYVRLKIRLSVRFHEDADAGYYKSVLNQELQRYLAPWAYDRSADILFGNLINASLIVNFVDERPYIDYVAALKFFTARKGEQFTLYTPPDEDRPENSYRFDPAAILVSDRSHEIDLITEQRLEEKIFAGIGHMKIELDFQVG